MVHLGKDIIPRLAEKGWFGRWNIRVGRFLTAGLWLYQTGAVLGRARRGRLETLAKMFSDHPGREREALNWLQDLAAKRIDKYGREPESFFDFFMTTEYEKAGVSWPPASLDAIKGVDNEKIPLEQAERLQPVRLRDRARQLPGALPVGLVDRYVAPSLEGDHQPRMAAGHHLTRGRLHRRLRPAEPGDGANGLQPLYLLRLLLPALAGPRVEPQLPHVGVPDPAAAEEVAVLRHLGAQYSTVEPTRPRKCAR